MEPFQSALTRNALPEYIGLESPPSVVSTISLHTPVLHPHHAAPRTSRSKSLWPPATFHSRKSRTTLVRVMESGGAGRGGVALRCQAGRRLKAHQSKKRTKHLRVLVMKFRSHVISPVGRTASREEPTVQFTSGVCQHDGCGMSATVAAARLQTSNAFQLHIRG